MRAKARPGGTKRRARQRAMLVERARERQRIVAALAGIPVEAIEHERRHDRMRWVPPMLLRTATAVFSNPLPTYQHIYDWFRLMRDEKALLASLDDGPAETDTHVEATRSSAEPAT